MVMLLAQAPGISLATSPGGVVWAGAGLVVSGPKVIAWIWGCLGCPTIFLGDVEVMYMGSLG